MVSAASSTHNQNVCAVCEQPATKRCSKCQKIYYCSVACQKENWKVHKPLCARSVKHIKPPSKMPSDLLEKVEANGLMRSYLSSREMHSLKERMLPEGLHPLPETPDRINMWLMIFAFPQDFQFFEKISEIASIKILERVPRIDPQTSEGCSWFLWKEESWYQKGFDLRDFPLYSFLGTTLQFFQENGYAQTSIPRVGNIVVYATNVHGPTPAIHSQFIVRHYGKVARILGDGKIIVHSKFASGHVYEHPLETIFFNLGNAYTFLAKSTPTAE